MAYINNTKLHVSYMYNKDDKGEEATHLHSEVVLLNNKISILERIMERVMDDYKINNSFESAGKIAIEEYGQLYSALAKDTLLSTI